jgi:hypothetical protein
MTASERQLPEKHAMRGPSRTPPYVQNGALGHCHDRQNIDRKKGIGQEAEYRDEVWKVSETKKGGTGNRSNRVVQLGHWRAVESDLQVLGHGRGAG